MATWLFVAALLLRGSASAQVPQAALAQPGENLEIALVTVGPGQIYWERFGHNAIAVRDRDTGETALYNYGIFDFYQESFLLNFIRGRMSYIAAVAPYERELEAYRRRGRSIDVQWLALPPIARAQLRDFLEWNVRPENAAYRYDYFVDNCSTRVRDALDKAAGGAIARNLDGRSRGFTFRMHARRLTAPDRWLYLGIHAGLAGYSDRPISFWEEAFVPMELQRRIREVKLPDAQGRLVPLVAGEASIAAAAFPPPEPVPPSWRWVFAGVGLALGASVALLARRKVPGGARRVLAVFAAVFWFAMGSGGVAMAGLWLFTEHRSAWANENLLQFDPLCLLLLPAALALGSGRARPPSHFARRVGLAVALLAAAGLFIKVLPGFRQDNLDWILLLLPIHAALAYALSQRIPSPS